MWPHISNSSRLSWQYDLSVNSLAPGEQGGRKRAVHSETSLPPLKVAVFAGCPRHNPVRIITNTLHMLGPVDACTPCKRDGCRFPALVIWGNQPTLHIL